MGPIRFYLKNAITALMPGHKIVVDHVTQGTQIIDWADVDAQIQAKFIDPSTGKLRSEYMTQGFTSEQVNTLTDRDALTISDAEVNKRLVRVAANSIWYIPRASGTGPAIWLPWYDPAGQFGLGTASTKNVAATGNAAAAEVVMGNDTRLINAPQATAVFDYERYIKCRVATLANVALTGLQTIDGQTLVDGDYVAVIQQTTGTENGVYVAHASAWARASELPAGANASIIDLFITAGTVWAGTWLRCATAGQVVGSSAVLYSTAGQPIGGANTIKSTSGTLTRANIGQVIRPSAGSLTFTLDLVSVIASGVIVIHGDAYGCTVACSGSDLFLLPDGTTAASMTLLIGASVILQSNTTNRWLVIAKNTGGAAGTKTVAFFGPLVGNPPATNFATQGVRAASILDTSLRTLDFNDTTEQSINFVGIIPEGMAFVSGFRIRIHWRGATATTGNVRWVASIGKLGSPNGTPIEVTSAVPTSNTTSGTAASVAEIVVTSLGGVSASRDPFCLTVIRRAADATNDTMVGDAQLLTVELAAA